MSLDSNMNAVVHSMATAASARRQALEQIRLETARHLVETRADRQRMMAAQRMMRSEALRSTHLATAMILGKANELIDEFRRQRTTRAVELKRTLTDEAKRLRVRTRKWLGTEAAMRKRLAGVGRRERLAYRASLRKTVAANSKRHREFLESLSKDRCLAAGEWRSYPKVVLAPRSGVSSDKKGHAPLTRQGADAPVVAKRDVEVKAGAKREVEAEAAVKREAEAAVKREAEAKRTSESVAKTPPMTS